MCVCVIVCALFNRLGKVLLEKKFWLEFSLTELIAGWGTCCVF